MKPRISQLDQSGAADGDVIVWDDTLGEWVPGAGGGAGGHTVQEEGTPLTARTGLNFIGGAATASDDSGGDKTDVTIRPHSTFPYSYTGTLVVATGTFRLYVERTFTITAVRASVGTAPTGATVIVDVHKNGTTIFTNQAHRPAIAISGNTATASTIDVTALSAGDYLTVDIDQIGSSTPGSNLTVTVEVAET
jgi:hypothetical protein